MATAPALCPLLLRALYPLLLLLLPPPSAASLGCPRTCVCDSPGGQLPVRCEKPPLSLPRDSVGNVSVLAITGGSARTLDWNGTRLPNLRVLNLSRSGIDTLDRTSFPAPPLSLESLDLSDNGLRNISPEAFADLRELRTLELSRALHGDSASGAAAALLAAVSEARLGNLAVLRLSGNGIRELAPGTLSALRALEVLDLRRNALRRLSNATLEEMNSLPRLREVWLAGNAFVCDCHLAETVLWLTDRNRGRNKARDASSLVCTVTPGSSSAAAAGGGASAGPTAVFNTTSLLSLQTLRGCAGEPVASYVLLGIVVALIGVIFLFVLYLNRRGIKKWLTHIRDACRDQIEEYNYRYELDANPRIANVVPPLEL